MPLQLRVLAGRDCGRIFPLREGEPFLLGRDMGCHARLKDPHVAMLHCQVVVDQQGATLTDRGSSGGTFVEGQRVVTHQLRQGDVFRLGDTRICFEWKDDSRAVLPGQAGERLGLLATATVDEGGRADLTEPSIVWHGEAFVAAPKPAAER